MTHKPQVNEYQATILRKAWFRTKIETMHVVARNKTEALKEVKAKYPPKATVSVKFVGTVNAS
jgi:hypothetical protein